MIEWPNKSRITFFRTYSPDSLRGMSLHVGWGVGYSFWKASDHGKESLFNLELATRLGENPLLLLTN